jgi:hypothetical protein
MLSQDSRFRLAALKTSRGFVICRRKLGSSYSLHSFSALRVDMLLAQQSRDDGGCGAFEVCKIGAGRVSDSSGTFKSARIAPRWRHALTR